MYSGDSLVLAQQLFLKVGGSLLGNLHKVGGVDLHIGLARLTASPTGLTHLDSAMRPFVLAAIIKEFSTEHITEK